MTRMVAWSSIEGRVHPALVTDEPTAEVLNLVIFVGNGQALSVLNVSRKIDGKDGWLEIDEVI